MRAGIALQLQHDAGALIAFVTQAADFRNDLFCDQFCDAFDEHRAVHDVGNFCDNDLLLALLIQLDIHPPAHLQRAAARVHVGIDSGLAENGAARGKVRTFDVLLQFPHRDVRLVDLGTNAIHHFAEIVRGHVRRHAHRDAGAAIDDQVREG